MTDDPKPSRPDMPRKKRKSEYALQVPAPTEKSVFEDAKALLPTKTIAKKYDTTERKLKLRFSRALSLGRAAGEAEIAHTLHEGATRGAKPNLRSAIFLAQSQLGWSRPPSGQGVTGPEARPWQRPIVVPEGSKSPVLIVPGLLDKDEWQARAKEHQEMMTRLSAQMYERTQQPAKPAEEPQKVYGARPIEQRQQPRPPTIQELRRQMGNPKGELETGPDGIRRLKPDPNIPPERPPSSRRRRNQ